MILVNNNIQKRVHEGANFKAYYFDGFNTNYRKDTLTAGLHNDIEYGETKSGNPKLSFTKNPKNTLQILFSREEPDINENQIQIINAVTAANERSVKFPIHFGSNFSSRLYLISVEKVLWKDTHGNCHITKEDGDIKLRPEDLKDWADKEPELFKGVVFGKDNMEISNGYRTSYLNDYIDCTDYFRNPNFIDRDIEVALNTKDYVSHKYYILKFPDDIDKDYLIKSLNIIKDKNYDAYIDLVNKNLSIIRKKDLLNDIDLSVINFNNSTDISRNGIFESVVDNNRNFDDNYDFIKACTDANPNNASMFSFIMEKYNVICPSFESGYCNIDEYNNITEPRILELFKDKSQEFIEDMFILPNSSGRYENRLSEETIVFLNNNIIDIEKCSDKMLIRCLTAEYNLRRGVNQAQFFNAFPTNDENFTNKINDMIKNDGITEFINKAYTYASLKNHLDSFLHYAIDKCQIELNEQEMLNLINYLGERDELITDEPSVYADNFFSITHDTDFYVSHNYQCSRFVSDFINNVPNGLEILTNLESPQIDKAIDTYITKLDSPVRLTRERFQDLIDQNYDATDSYSIKCYCADVLGVDVPDLEEIENDDIIH